MSRLVAVALLCTGCDDTLEDRLAELDDQVTVDCGRVGECGQQPGVDTVVACLRDNLAAGVPAKAFFVLSLEEVGYVYALDGSFVAIEGYYYEGNHFTESLCRDLEVDASRMCVRARATDCDYIRDWE